MKNKYKEQLNKKGYILIKNHFSDEEKTAINMDIQYLYTRKDTPGKIMKYYESSIIDGGILLNRIENFIDSNEIKSINKIEKKVSLLLSSIIEEKYLLFKDKINLKLSGGGGFKPHQDHPAFTKFIKKEMFNIMIPIDDMKISNGCLYISKIPFKRKIMPINKGEVLKTIYKKYKWIPIQAKFGDLIIFSSFILHKSNDNLTDTHRKCIFLTYNNSLEGNLRENYFRFKRKSFPPMIERDSTIDYSNWKNKLARKLL
ncbi:phytanoyl-CoA dioxygenase family protein [Xenorhabdus sp. Reich]|uniref:Phytanoyl-CoA dioxygenase family protein n=1 Tax=Xenorhabdus littoralis TaxID=2582835 RepID=A0ABU4SGF8_9GAMM|nr:phytanoyl-CoA dioxygenase family protein [Xenorhabdus sp. Reich]MDX7997733.1 phytanoyl-CoA dioxygenase family protein [Xenorhabdus sp. Reich]